MADADPAETVPTEAPRAPKKAAAQVPAPVEPALASEPAGDPTETPSRYLLLYVGQQPVTVMVLGGSVAPGETASVDSEELANRLVATGRFEHVVE